MSHFQCLEGGKPMEMHEQWSQTGENEGFSLNNGMKQWWQISNPTFENGKNIMNNSLNK